MTSTQEIPEAERREIELRNKAISAATKELAKWNNVTGHGGTFWRMAKDVIDAYETKRQEQGYQMAAPSERTRNESE